VALPGRKFSVICGAPNAAVGLRTAFAPPGAVLPVGGEVKAARIRGVVSEGILCSERELGIGDDHRGILELPSEAPIGTDLSTYLGLDDVVFEIEITPNRPDALSVVGVAREVAALTSAPFRFPHVTVKEGEDEAAALTSVEIEAPDLCPRFCARLLTGLTVRPSPPWLAQRLRAVGLRPINNLVDVTNYVMWELGQPLHAFDFETLAQRRIVVRRARPGERLKTLDGQERALGSDMVMVCDAERPVAVGGVMGGAETEVTERTTSLLLEAAYWDPGSIRRTSRALGLLTDAAYRFERGGDIDAPPEALGRAAQLMADLGGGRVARGIIDVYPTPRPRPRLTLRPARVERLIGVAPPREEAVRILQALGFAVHDSAPDLQVVVPSFRRDVSQEDDLIEEIIRIWGFDKIPLTLAGSGEILPVRRPATLRVSRAVSQALNAAGLFECITYAFVDPERLRAMGWEDAARLIALQNPLSQERSVLRPSLAPGLLEVLATNLHRQTPDVQVFEVGHIFGPHRDEDGDQPAHEELWMGLALTGSRQARAWFGSRDKMDVYDAKGMAEAARPVCETFDLPAPVFVAELSLTALTRLPAVTPRYQPLPRFPAVLRDLAIVVPADITAGEVEAAIRGMKLPLLTRLTLFDVYTGGQVGKGRRSLAWSLTFQAEDRTLTDKEVNDLHAKIVKEVARRFKAEVRGA
jgi:phenylalanyl-tRNA synthetase beta chain